MVWLGNEPCRRLTNPYLKEQPIMLGFRKSHTRPSRAPRPLGQLEQLEGREVPAIFAVTDFYTAAPGQVLSVPASGGIAPSPIRGGVLANDFSDLNPGAVMTATLVGLPTYVVPPGFISPPGTVPGTIAPLPANSLFLNPDGSFTFLAPSRDVIPLGVTQVQFTYQVTNTAGETALGQAFITIGFNQQRFTATGAGPGGGPHVRVYDTGTGNLVYNFFPYEPTFTGGVRVAVGDLNNDGIDDLVTIPATGGAPRIRVFDGKDGSPIIDQFAFDPNFRGGGYVAIGDFNGDQLNDIIVGAGEGGGPRVQVFTVSPNVTGVASPQNPNNSPNFLQPISDFFAYDPLLPGTVVSQTGVRVAAGDVQGIGRDFIIAAPGNGGGSQVKVFDYQQLVQSTIGNIAQSVLTFDAGIGGDLNGVNVASGNIRGDGKFDIVTGTASGTGIVRVWDGRTGGLLNEFTVPSDETPTGTGFQSGPGTFNFQNSGLSGSLLNPNLPPNSLVPGGQVAGTLNPVQGAVFGGVTVASADWNGDGLADIIVGNGPGSPPRLRVFDARTHSEISSILAYSATFLGGIDVAAGHPLAR
jgi:hypothetical protein